MSCLYGDSTASELELDYLALLRNVLDFSVTVLLAADRIAETREIADEACCDAERDKEQLRGLALRLVDALHPDITQDESASGQCAAAIARATKQAIDLHLDKIERDIKTDFGYSDSVASRERTHCHEALERLLLADHRLPGMESELRIELESSNCYRASLHGRANFGLETSIDLDIPADNLLANVVRAGQLVDSPELHFQEERGWISKKVKSVRHRLAKHTLVGATIGENRVTLQLRSSSVDVGVDIAMDGSWSSPRVALVPEGADGAGLLESSGADELQLRAMCEAVSDIARPLLNCRAALSVARLDGTAIANHDSPGELVDRIVAAMAPIVQEIARHSPRDDELVLKRTVGLDRREEVFVRKSELRRQLAPLRPGLQSRFAALGLFSTDSFAANINDDLDIDDNPISPIADDSISIDDIDDINESVDIDVSMLSDTTARPPGAPDSARIAGTSNAAKDSDTPDTLETPVPKAIRARILSDAKPVSAKGTGTNPAMPGYGRARFTLPPRPVPDPTASSDEGSGVTEVELVPQSGTVEIELDESKPLAD